jgi:phospholipase C
MRTNLITSFLGRASRPAMVLGLMAIGLVPDSGQAGHAANALDTSTTTPIKHYIVLMQENHSFDNYFGTYPGADGFPEGLCVPVNPFDEANTECVEPFHLEGGQSADLDHTEQTHKLQFNEGKMDGFVYALNERNQEGELALGYYDDQELPYYWNLADEYVLFDRFFTAAHGGSVVNHMYWVAGQSGGGEQIPDGGYGDDIVTIFDRLEEAGISWKFYVQNYDPTLTFRTVDSVKGNRASQVIWVPILNFPRFVDNPELFQHIVNLDEYHSDLQNGTLPAVSFIVPAGASEHPPGSIIAGQRFVQTLINALMQSEAWSSSAFMWTYDDWGGWYDHVPPPAVDEWGYGFRAPALLVSPYAKPGYIDSTTLDFTSMLKFIEENWNVPPIAERDANANNFLDAFDFSAPPRDAAFVGWVRNPADRLEPNRSVLYLTYGGAISVTGGCVVLALFIARRRRMMTARGAGV